MAKSGYLTAQEYKALRELLGFTQEEAKEFHKVQNIRTIKRWESGYSRVSEIACDKIMDLAKKIDWSISQCIKIALEQDIKEAVLIVYPDSSYRKFAVGFSNLPNSVHRAAVARTYAAMTNANIKCGIVEFNVQDYMAFLAANGLTDSQNSRSVWATDYRQRLILQ